MSKILAIKKCDWCGKDIEIKHKHRLNFKNVFCCKECEGAFKRDKSPKNCICPVCGTPFHSKPFHKNKYNNIFCSRKCKKLYDSKKMTGEGNHQYGLKGSLNASWKSDERISSYGYRLIRSLNHPFRNGDDFVFEHRLIIEQYMLTPENSIEINGTLYLSPEWDVHHIDFNRLNNNPSNLFPLPTGVHMKFHGKNPNLKEQTIEERQKRFFEFINQEAMCQGVIQQYFKTIDDITDGARSDEFGSIT